MHQMLLKCLLPPLLAALLASCSYGPRISNDNTGFGQFIIDNYHREKLRSFERHLKIHKVHGIVPTQALLQQGVDWQANGQPRYAFPPRQMWGQIVGTLKILQTLIIPAIGPVKVVSGYRTKSYNLAAGGAPRSQHLDFSAIDVVPTSNITRETLHRKLWAIWNQHGEPLKLGLGLYPGTRFHIDTGRFRAW